MGKEILAVPEESLPETIRIIRAGLRVAWEEGWLSKEVSLGLSGWCNRLSEPDEGEASEDREGE